MMVSIWNHLADATAANSAAAATAANSAAAATAANSATAATDTPLFPLALFVYLAEILIWGISCRRVR